MSQTIILNKSPVGGPKVKLKYKGLMYSANGEEYARIQAKHVREIREDLEEVCPSR